jgi:predicted transcriptional regulator
MISRLVDAFFGCWHTNLTFPITARSAARRNAAASLTGTYVVCLDCGKEFAYDWRQMKIVDETREHPSTVADLAPKQAA